MSDLASTVAEGLGPTETGDLFTVSFADGRAGICGQARIAPLPGGGRQTLVCLFEGPRVLVAEAVAEGSIALSVISPGVWSLVFGGGSGGRDGGGGGGAAHGEGAFALELEASGPAAVLGDPQHEREGASAQQPCSVRGTITIDGTEVALAARGQVGLARGAAEWSQRTLWREIDCWLAEGRALAVRASRPAGVSEHGRELVEAVLVEAEPALAAPVDETRVSTTYDPDGRQSSAGLELWPTPDSDYPRRIAGRLLCATTVRVSGDETPGAPGLRWDCAFLRWYMESAEGVGPYSIVRPQTV